MVNYSVPLGLSILKNEGLRSVGLWWVFNPCTLAGQSSFNNCFQAGLVLVSFFSSLLAGIRGLQRPPSQHFIIFINM